MCDNKVTSVNETAGKETEPQEKKNFHWILQLKSNLYINYKVIKRVLELIELDEFVFNERPWLKTIFDMAEDFTLADVLLECAGDENDTSVTESLRSTFDQLEEITDLPREVLVGVRQTK